MPRTAAILYMAGLVFAEALRFPHRVARLRSREPQHSDRSRYPLEWLVMVAVILGIWVFPLVYACTGWLHPFDYRLPPWTSWAAAAVFAVSLIIRLKAQRSLGRQWSFTVETREGHKLVTDGVYSRVRHPLYASLLLWAAAQLALLPNLIAGWGGAVAVGLIWLLRVPREERMMLEEFGHEYKEYMARTGRLFPTQRQHRQVGP